MKQCKKLMSLWSTSAAASPTASSTRPSKKAQPDLYVPPAEGGDPDLILSKLYTLRNLQPSRSCGAIRLPHKPPIHFTPLRDHWQRTSLSCTMPEDLVFKTELKEKGQKDEPFVLHCSGSVEGDCIIKGDPESPYLSSLW